jgi:hypothetical protein
MFKKMCESNLLKTMGKVKDGETEDLMVSIWLNMTKKQQDFFEVIQNQDELRFETELGIHRAYEN